MLHTRIYPLLSTSSDVGELDEPIDAQDPLIEQPNEPAAQLAPVQNTPPVVEERPLATPEPQVVQEPTGTDPTPATPVESTGVRRSTRTRTQTKPAYVPSMTGKRYAMALAQIVKDEAIRTENHFSFFESMQEESPQVVARVMTQLSMKAGLKAWGNKAKTATYDEIYQLHMRAPFAPSPTGALH